MNDPSKHCEYCDRIAEFPMETADRKGSRVVEVSGAACDEEDYYFCSLQCAVAFVKAQTLNN